MQDREIKLLPGWVGLGFWLVWAGLFSALLIDLSQQFQPQGWRIVLQILLGLVGLVSLFGFIINSPNHARVIQFFGTYVGTLKDVGFFWGNPFYATSKVSLRVRTFETGVKETPEVKDAAGKVIQAASSTRHISKVNDRDGTPIEIAAVVVWKVVNAAGAVFNVDDYEDYIWIQSEAALRNLASRYSYDASEDDTHSLRGHIDEVAKQLKFEVQERMHEAGIEILEARISTLAYAPEIAAAMLQRQQASAVIAARKLIVEGAVGMVEHALDELSKKGLVELTAESKAMMTSNLMVVLCSHNSPTPVLHTGGGLKS
jgi:regulator of protease activity HflC (stomatin/prohibitin superfamily)